MTVAEKTVEMTMIPTPILILMPSPTLMRLTQYLIPTQMQRQTARHSVMIRLFYQDHPEKTAQHPKELPRLIIQSLRRTLFASSLAFADLTDRH
jgi:hypothetical protein